MGWFTNWGASLLSGVLGIGGNLAGGKMTADSQARANRENIQYQKEFAQHGIKWRVQDAIDAGLHPLAALGAQTSSFAPSSVGSDYGYLGNMGQDMRDIVKKFDQKNRNRMDIEDKMKLEELRHMELINLGLRKDLDGGSPDNMTDHMQDPSKVVVQPSQPTAMGNPGIAAGIYPMMKYTQAPGGWIFPTPQQDIQELISEGMNPTQARYMKDWIKDRSLDVKHMRNPFTPESYEYRKFLMTIRPTTYADGTPLKKGDEYRYETNSGFKLYRNVKKSQFYVKDYGISNNNPIQSIMRADDEKPAHNPNLYKKMKGPLKYVTPNRRMWR